MVKRQLQKWLRTRPDHLWTIQPSGAIVQLKMRGRTRTLISDIQKREAEGFIENLRTLGVAVRLLVVQDREIGWELSPT